MRPITDAMHELEQEQAAILEKRQIRYDLVKCFVTYQDAKPVIKGDRNKGTLNMPYLRYEHDDSKSPLKQLASAIECYLRNSLPYTADSPDTVAFFQGLAAALTELLVTAYKNNTSEQASDVIARKLNSLICPQNGHGIINVTEAEGDDRSHKRYSIKTQFEYLGGLNYQKWQFEMLGETIEPNLTIHVSGQEERHRYDEVKMEYDDFDGKYYPTGGDPVLYNIRYQYRIYVEEVLNELIEVLDLNH